MRGVPALFLVLRPDERFTVLDASDEYLRATLTRREEIVGRGLFEVFPDNPAEPDAQGVARLRASLERVLATRSADAMPITRYDIRRPGEDGGGFIERHWNPVNAPVLADDGSIEVIVHRVEDATEVVRLRKQDAYFRDVAAYLHAQAERDRIVAESDAQRRLYEAALSNTPDLVYIFGLDHRFVYANEALLAMWGKTREEAIGGALRELGYEEWHAAMHDREIEQVIATRLPVRGEVPFTGTHGRRIYEYIFVPVIGAGGEVVAVAGTTRDVTERREAEQAIEEQAQRLREADRAKDEFIATLSHELRNPLAPLRSALALLRMGAPPEDAPRIHTMMERQVEYLVRLVDDLLELSRVTRGDFALRRTRVRMQDVVANAVEATESTVRSRGHELAIQLPAEPLWVDGDAVRLAQVVSNLLDNAAKYTPEGGRIEVRADREGALVAVRVRDNGPGIPAEALPRIFEMFNRGGRGQVRGEAGLGIGLALARRLAQMHGGTVDATSEGAGRGAEFTLRVPAASGAGEAEAAGEAPPAVASRRILVVDDNRDAAESLAMVLRAIGAEVRVAGDGTDALAVFADYDPAVVLLDIGMPGMSGYDVARALRERFPQRRPALIALTGWGQEEDRARAREAGFDHHLVKPADIGRLQSLLASI